MRKKMMYTGLCLLFALIFGLYTVEAQEEQAQAESPKAEFSSAADRARPLINAEFSFRPSVFSGIISEKKDEDDESERKEIFPPGDFVNPERARQLLGDYEIDVTFYNKDYEEVDGPTTAGRSRAGRPGATPSC